MSSKPQAKMLLLQICKEEKVRQEELSRFIQYSGLSHKPIEVLNVFAPLNLKATSAIQMMVYSSTVLSLPDVRYAN